MSGPEHGPQPRRAPRRAAKRTNTSPGFTLLEVLVALAILSLAVVASIQGFAQGLRLLKLSGDHQQAMLLADQKAREVLQFEEGRQEGTDGAFRWERTTLRREAPELTPLTGPPRWQVFEIAVRVSWDERRQLEITTLRTVPASATQPVGPTSRSSPGTSLAR